MTHGDMVMAVASSPAVIQHATTQKADGTINVPSPAELKADADIAVAFAVADMMNWTWVRMNLGRKREQITLTSKEYTLPDSVKEILSVTIGTRKEPITPFWDVAAFNKWMYERLGDNDPPVADTENTAERYHVFLREAGGQFILTFEPGIGDDTTAEIWHMGGLAAPWMTEMIPEALHGYLYVVAINYATGFAYDGAVDRIKGLVAERVTTVHGAMDPAQQDPLVEGRAVLRNRMYTDFIS